MQGAAGYLNPQTIENMDANIVTQAKTPLSRTPNLGDDEEQEAQPLHFHFDNDQKDSGDHEAVSEINVVDLG